MSPLRPNFPWEDKKIQQNVFLLGGTNLAAMKDKHLDLLTKLQAQNDQIFRQRLQITSRVTYFEKQFIERRIRLMKKQLRDVLKQSEKKMCAMNKTLQRRLMKNEKHIQEESRSQESDCSLGHSALSHVNEPGMERRKTLKFDTFNLIQKQDTMMSIKKNFWAPGKKPLKKTANTLAPYIKMFERYSEQTKNLEMANTTQLGGKSKCEDGIFKMRLNALSPQFEKPTTVRVKLLSPSTTKSINKKQSEFTRVLENHSPSKFIKRRRCQGTP